MVAGRVLPNLEKVGTSCSLIRMQQVTMRFVQLYSVFCICAMCSFSSPTEAFSVTTLQVMLPCSSFCQTVQNHYVTNSNSFWFYVSFNVTAHFRSLVHPTF